MQLATVLVYNDYRMVREVKNGTRELMNFLRFMTREYSIFQKDQACCCGTTMAQSQAIMEIGSGEISLVQLAANIGLDRSTMSRTVHNLVKMGLVHRVEDLEDRRYVVLRLSADGMMKYRFIEDQVLNYLGEVLDDIPAEKRDQVLESLILLEAGLRQKISCCGEGSCRCGCKGDQ